MRAGPFISLLTDFGLSDGYVGIVKAVILGIAPQARLMDLTHEIAPQAVRQAAFTLAAAYPYYPAGCIHLAVVDPGVGSQRRAIAFRTSRAILVGPDNGLFSYVLTSDRALEAVELTNPAYRLPVISNTFHGRDVFAPAAAHLALGVPLAALGSEIVDWVHLPLPMLDLLPDGRILAEIIHVDHFGNAITSLGRLEWQKDVERLTLAPVFRPDAPVVDVPRDCQIWVGDTLLRGICRTFSDVGPGQVLALVGSSGHLEIALRNGNAAEQLGLSPGDRVSVRL